MRILFKQADSYHAAHWAGKLLIVLPEARRRTERRGYGDKGIQGNVDGKQIGHLTFDVLPNGKV